MVIEPDINVMLRVEKFFQTFTKKALCDTAKCTEIVVSSSCGRGEELNDPDVKVVAASGTTPRDPQDHGFMYGHAFEDLDGHTWDLMVGVPGGPA